MRNGKPRSFALLTFDCHVLNNQFNVIVKVSLFFEVVANILIMLIIGSIIIVAVISPVMNNFCQGRPFLRGRSKDESVINKRVGCQSYYRE